MIQTQCKNIEHCWNNPLRLDDWHLNMVWDHIFTQLVKKCLSVFPAEIYSNVSLPRVHECANGLISNLLFVIQSPVFIQKTSTKQSRKLRKNAIDSLWEWLHNNNCMGNSWIIRLNRNSFLMSSDGTRFGCLVVVMWLPLASVKGRENHVCLHRIGGLPKIHILAIAICLQYEFCSGIMQHNINRESVLLVWMHMFRLFKRDYLHVKALVFVQIMLHRCTLLIYSRRGTFRCQWI